MNKLSMQAQDFFAHPTAVIEAGATIGSQTSVWHFCHIMPDAIIGSHCILGQNVFVDNNAAIGNGVKIQNNVAVYNSVIIEDDAFIGPSVVFTNVINPRSFIDRKTEFKPTLIKQGATLGANSTIICGITIGRYAMIGAGAVVVDDVPDYCLVVGNKAAPVGWVSRHGHKLLFDAAGKAACPETGEIYSLTHNQVLPEKG